MSNFATNPQTISFLRANERLINDLEKRKMKNIIKHLETVIKHKCYGLSLHRDKLASAKYVIDILRIECLAKDQAISIFRNELNQKNIELQKTKENLKHLENVIKDKCNGLSNLRTKMETKLQKEIKDSASLRSKIIRSFATSNERIKNERDSAYKCIANLRQQLDQK